MPTLLPDARPETRRASPFASLVWIPGGECIAGSNQHYPEERPARRVAVKGFWIDRFPVTNLEFSRFVEATGWVTVAERVPDAEAYPGALAHLLHAGSVVFVKPTRRTRGLGPADCWCWVRGADWRHPQGPGSHIDDRMDHPVVHVALADVEAYAAWAGQDVPTEVEWEYAARGGLACATYAWGEELTPGRRFLANTWQGLFPHENLCEDGYEGTSPVDAYPPNGYGVFDMIGNVWEWTRDWYRAGPGLAPGMPRKVIKGGSHLSAPNHCRRYRPAARQPQPVESSACHIGFRCILRPSAGA